MAQASSSTQSTTVQPFAAATRRNPHRFRSSGLASLVRSAHLTIKSGIAALSRGGSRAAAIARVQDNGVALPKSRIKAK